MENIVKTLLVLNGAPGIGKSVTAREIQKRLYRSVWLDGDWCWMANPWIVTQETKEVAESNMAFVLSNFLGCSEYRYVIYSWLFRRNEVLRSVLDRLTTSAFETIFITLTCEPETYKSRLMHAGRKNSDIQRHVKTLAMCSDVDAIQIETTGVAIPAVVEAILTVLGVGNR